MEDFETIWEMPDKHLTGTTVETLAQEDRGVLRLSDNPIAGPACGKRSLGWRGILGFYEVL